MNNIMTAILDLKQAAEEIKGEVKSITLDKNAYDFAIEYSQYCSGETSLASIDKLFGIEIKKGQ